MGTLALILMAGVVYAKRDVILERFENKAAQASASGRLGQFPYAVEMSMKNPVVGIGPGLSSFFGSWNNYDQYIKNEEQVQGVIFHEQVHNAFLQYFLESGMPGAILFALLCLLVLYQSVRKTKRSSSHELVHIGGAAAAFAYILHTQFGTEINNQQMMLLFAFALGLSTNKYLVGQSTAHKR
jgi:O-antigen ligase